MKKCLCGCGQNVKSKYVSPSHCLRANHWNYGNYRGVGRVIIECRNCGKSFFVPKCRASKRSSCSRKCSTTYKWKNPSYRQKQIEKKANPEYRRAASEHAKRGWGVDRDERIRAILRASRISPNKAELLLFNHINGTHPTYTLNVSGEVIAGFVPDYVDHNQKKVIELFGERWHPKSDEERKVGRYAEHGWQCLVIWWKELKDEEALLAKISDFAWKRCYL